MGKSTTDGCSLNREFVAAGMVWWYRQYTPGDATLSTLEAEARAAKRGLWRDPHAVWRRGCGEGRRGAQGRRFCFNGDRVQYKPVVKHSPI
jgi:endonuclease YncB( thermonuclease family)